jgi:hypothetical protein
MSFAEIVALSCTVFTNVVGFAKPFHCTTDVGVKFEPVSVSAKSVAPNAAAVGEMKERVGIGLGDIFTDSAFEAAVPGLLTVIES